MRQRKRFFACLVFSLIISFQEEFQNSPCASCLVSRDAAFFRS